MKEFNTITEYQLLYLARKELERRINEIKDEIIRNGESRRLNIHLDMYTKQSAELLNRMVEINRQGDNNDY